MKRNSIKLILLSLCSLAFLFVSCGKNEKPEYVAEEFFNAFLKRDYEKMEKYASAELIVELEKEKAEVKAGNELPEEKKEIFDELDKAKKTYSPAEITDEGMKATVKVKFEDIDPEDETSDPEDNYWTIMLIKEQGRWKVSDIPIK